MVTTTASPERGATRKGRGIYIERFESNPLLIPNPKSVWMRERIFNCGVIKDDDGLYKMLFRATFLHADIADSYSNLGFAWSVDGLDWHLKDAPVLRSGFDQNSIRGVEDPRIVRWIDGWYYIFASVLSDDVRIGIWRTQNFHKYEWIGLPFSDIGNSAAVFPELIDSHAYLLHRKFPDIWVSRTLDISLRGGWRDHRVAVEAGDLYPSLETGVPPRKIGMAAPPIKTPQGWLVLTYVAHGKRFEEVYSIGFVVLDLHDPTQIKYVHPSPILWPEKAYEMRDGKRGICYSCAAVESPDGKSLYVYWGAADKVIAGGSLMKEDLVGICY